jgi:hypothetical protein
VEAPDEFSAGRALTRVDALAASPRPPGSAGHARARAYLLDELASLGWRTEVQQAVGAANREGATDPRQEAQLYTLDADRDVAFWVSPIPPRSEWSRDLLTQPPAPLDDTVPWAAGELLPHGPAPVVQLAPPDVAVVSDTVRGDVRELTLRLSSPRRAPTIGLWVGEPTVVRRAVIAGREVRVHGRWEPWSFDFLFHGAAADAVTVRLELERPAERVTLRVADRSDDLDAAPTLSMPPAGRVLTNPQLVVTREVAV